MTDISVKTVGVHGIGGIGKSWLAASVYRDWKAEKFWADVSQYPEFVVFAEQILKTFSGNISANFVQLGLTEQVNQLIHCLGKQRRLLVIDNLETLLDHSMRWRDAAYQQFFSRWREQGHTSVLLITTQDKPTSLLEEPAWLNLTGLAPTEGSRLLEELGVQGTEEALKAFSITLDGHPLSLRLAATFLREYCNGSLNQAEKLRLAEFEQIVTQAEGEHRSSPTRLEWILQRHLEQLTNEQQTFLENLSVYRLPFDESAAMTMVSPVASNSLVETVKKLRRLFNRSLLLQSENNHYQLQPSIKKYVQYIAENLTGAHQQAIAHYRTVAQPLPWRELEDVTEYLEIFYHCCELQRYAEAFNTLLDSGCDSFLLFQGYNLVRTELYQPLVQSWQPSDSEKESFNEMLNRLGIAYLSLGQYQKASELHYQHLNISRQIGDRLSEGNALGNLGNVRYALGQYQEAFDLYHQHLDISQEVNDNLGEVKALGNLGNVYYAIEQYSQAIEFHRQSLNIARQIKSRRDEAYALNSLGVAYYALGQHHRAIEFQQQSLNIAQQIGDRQGEVSSLSNLGNAYFALGNLGSGYFTLGECSQAIEFYQQSVEIARQIGDRQSAAIALGNLGAVLEILGQTAAAKANYQQARDLYAALGVEEWRQRCEDWLQQLE